MRAWSRAQPEPVDDSVGADQEAAEPLELVGPQQADQQRRRDRHRGDQRAAGTARARAR